MQNMFTFHMPRANKYYKSLQCQLCAGILTIHWHKRMCPLNVCWRRLNNFGIAALSCIEQIAASKYCFETFRPMISLMCTRVTALNQITFYQNVDFSTKINTYKEKKLSPNLSNDRIDVVYPKNQWNKTFALNAVPPQCIYHSREP